MNVMCRFLSLLFIITVKINFILGNSTTAATNTRSTTIETTTLSFVKTEYDEFDNTSAVKNAEELHKAVAGLGTDENKIIKIVASSEYWQIENIKTAYYTLYRKNLIEDIKDDTSGDFRDLVTGILESASSSTATLLNTFLTSKPLNYYCIALLLCTKEKPAIEYIQTNYLKLFNETLESTIVEYATGDFKEFLLRLLEPPIRFVLERRDLIQQQVSYIPLVNDTGTVKNSSALMELMAKASFNQLRYVLAAYETKYGVAVEEALQKHFKDPLLRAYLITVDFAKCFNYFFAKELNKATVEALNTKRLTTLIVTLKREGLQDILYEYKKNYNRDFKSAVEKATSGDYQKMLLAVIENELSEE
ncbi:annexin A13-like [Lycorma delicatula]|uniref:annexin A13-like n=1 Tax=Lycorma delicatula TaxID=130591 RepID=UPI003F510C90